MNPYAIYIWPCYILTFFLLGLNVVLTMVAKSKIIKQIRIREIRNNILDQ